MRKSSPDWVNILFLCLTPLVGLGGTAWYAATQGIVWWEPVLALALFMAIGIGIGSGYHRCFAHRTYECHPAAESVLLFFGALALQNSALRWARDHRDHHRFTDTDRDPYSVKRGFFWAHVFWVFYKETPDANFDNVPDLLKNPRVMWQHRWSRFLGIGVGLGLPTLIGALFGRPFGGLLWGGFLQDRPRPPHDVPHQLRRPPLGQAAVLDRRLGARQLVPRLFHARRGVPQLPPHVPVRLPQRSAVVPLGPEQVDDPGPQADGPRAKPPEDAGAAHRAGARARPGGGFQPLGGRRIRRRRNALTTPHPEGGFLFPGLFTSTATHSRI